MRIEGVEDPPVAGARSSWFSRVPTWFWLVMVMGAILRLHCVLFTEGTYDVSIWQRHADRVREVGLIHYYHETSQANHPPFMSEAGSFLLRAADSTGIPFRVLFRMPFALADAGTLALLLLLWREHPRRWILGSVYWLHPLAVLLSSYHGNTDSAVGFFLLLCVWLLSRDKTIGGAMALGASAWIKLPGILAVPALLFMVQGWRKRLVFLAVAGLTAVSTYLPALVMDGQVVCANVFGYHGQMLQTTAGVPVWGLRVLLGAYAPLDWLERPGELTVFIALHSWKIAVGLLVLLAWLRRTRQSPGEVCATIAAGYTLVYGLTDYWAFQYFAWSVPLWFFMPTWFLVIATVLAGGYIYSLYWYLCGNPWLLGKWDFIGHPHWPDIVIEFRNLAVLFFLVSAGWFLGSAAVAESKRWLRRHAARNVRGPKPDA